MTGHRDTGFISASCEQVFDLVADVERYPEFLPLWRWARIARKEEQREYVTEQEIGLGPIRERFVTRTMLARPTNIQVTSDDELFRAFHIHWEFVPMRSGCRASIVLRWEMRSRALQRAIDLLLPGVARSMVDAFRARADRELE
jgi:coenzyme Q-binding protein COQ10